MGNAELGLNGTLAQAIKNVLGHSPNSVEPVVVLAAYLHSLVARYGLTDSQHLDPIEFERPILPLEAREFVDNFVDSANTESLRNSLYKALANLADDGSVRSTLNKNRSLSHREVLLLGQVAWNLEHNDQRPLLPLLPGEILKDGKRVRADILVPGAHKDFATMHWTDRGNQAGVQGKSSGDTFRRQTGRLAVLAAQWFLDSHTKSAPTVGGARILNGTRAGIRRIVWASTTADQTDDAGLPTSAVQVLTDALPVPKGSPADQILVGNFAEVGDHYQPRALDNEIDRHWGGSGDRRVWLRGGPGLGKSYAARKIMQEALGSFDDERHNLLIWVESADAVAVTREFARAAERLDGGPKDSVAANAGDREDQLARGLLGHLRTTDMRWLIVLDDANAAELIERKLVPPGTNPRGRVLITTLSASHRISGSGHQVEAELFSPGEAEEFLSTRLPDTSEHGRAALSDTVRHHPLALSIAASTIAANRMTVSDWVKEFHEAPRMDEAADYSDPGGYPTLIGATWKVALDKAAQGMPNGVVERTAIIAAMQDPDGHPTWLWQRDGVREWVAGVTDLPATRTRMYPGVKRLVDYGIIQLTGSWQVGRLAIHQLAARAIREAAAPEELAQAGAVLAEQWLRELTSNPASAQPQDIRSAVGPIAALPTLNAWTRSTATALLGFSAPAADQTDIERDLWELELLEPSLARGGVIGRADIAERLTNIGRAQRELGRQTEAQKNLAAASSIYLDLAALPDLNDNLRAQYLLSLSDIDSELGHTELALERRRNAERLQTVWTERESTSSANIADMLALNEIYMKLLDDRRSEAALDKAMSIWESRPGADAAEDKDALTAAKLGQHLADAGRLAEAKAHLLQAASIAEKTKYGRSVLLQYIQKRLAHVCAQLGEWQESEELFKQTRCDPLLLASVQIHQGHIEEACVNIESSESIHSTRSSGAQDPGVHDFKEEIREIVEDSIKLTLVHLTSRAMEHERWEDAAGLANANLELVRAQADASPGEAPDRLASSYFEAGYLSYRAGRLDAAIAHFTNCANIWGMLSTVSPTADIPRVEHGWSLYFIASCHTEANRPEAAVTHALRAKEMIEQFGDDARQLRSATTSVLARALLQSGDAEEAVAVLESRVQSSRVALTLDPYACELQGALVDALTGLWKALVRLKRWEESVQPLIESVAICESLSAGGQRYRMDAATALDMLALASGELDRYSEAVAAAEQSAHIWQELLDSDPTNYEIQSKLAETLLVMAHSLGKLESDESAVRTLSRAADLLQLPAELEPTDRIPFLLTVLNDLEEGLRRLGRTDEANVAQRRADDLVRRYPQSDDTI
ncbi:tetratricopeptide repeat protein [Arthrobacter sunyaminii]|uniref:tetratricopeptide repeat protein n=1 Tax=Arthrobacter sunyaminii TaxID=2816859 RepID=UPI001A94256C|nr:tetratricopeptide repeat protein [Arthrobacter sunyaminii]MBO0895335.1 tetratricopeptide repeat protein [Arthrobacter sunyaminii]